MSFLNPFKKSSKKNVTIVSKSMEATVPTNLPGRPKNTLSRTMESAKALFTRIFKESPKLSTKLETENLQVQLAVEKVTTPENVAVAFSDIGRVVDAIRNRSGNADMGVVEQYAQAQKVRRKKSLWNWLGKLALPNFNKTTYPTIRRERDSLPEGKMSTLDVHRSLRIEEIKKENNKRRVVEEEMGDEIRAAVEAKIDESGVPLTDREIWALNDVEISKRVRAREVEAPALATARVNEFLRNNPGVDRDFAKIILSNQETNADVNFFPGIFEGRKKTAISTWKEPLEVLLSGDIFSKVLMAKEVNLDEIDLDGLAKLAYSKLNTFPNRESSQSVKSNLKAIFKLKLSERLKLLKTFNLEISQEMLDKAAKVESKPMSLSKNPVSQPVNSTPSETKEALTARLLKLLEQQGVSLERLVGLLDKPDN